eukprot:11322623-Prorocentrum_lima.AAC.1
MCIRDRVKAGSAPEWLMKEEAKALVLSPGAWTHPCKQDTMEEAVPNIYPKTNTASKHWLQIASWLQRG